MTCSHQNDIPFAHWLSPAYNADDELNPISNTVKKGNESD